LSQDHAAALVARLRAVRRQRRLTLLKVEHQSSGRFNAIVVGSGDRGDRAAAVPKPVELATSTVCPPKSDSLANEQQLGRRLAAGHRGFDLPRLAASAAREAGPLARYASAIRSQREDDDRDALTIREQDPRSVAVVHDRPVGDLTEMLVTWRCRGRLDGRETRKGSPPAPDGCRSVRAGPAIADRGTGIPSTVCPSEAVKDSRLSGDFDSPTSG